MLNRKASLGQGLVRADFINIRFQYHVLVNI
jgi:hypothetical protein